MDYVAQGKARAGLPPLEQEVPAARATADNDIVRPSVPAPARSRKGLWKSGTSNRLRAEGTGAPPELTRVSRSP